MIYALYPYLPALAGFPHPLSRDPCCHMSKWERKWESERVCQCMCELCWKKYKKQKDTHSSNTFKNTSINTKYLLCYMLKESFNFFLFSFPLLFQIIFQGSVSIHILIKSLYTYVSIHKHTYVPIHNMYVYACVHKHTHKHLYYV